MTNFLRFTMTRLTTTLPLLATLILSALQPFSLSALSQTIRWDPSGGSLAKGQVSQIQLVFENCQPQGNVAFPPVAGLELQHNGSRSQNFSSINGRTVQSVSFGFNARPTTEQRVTIPAFKINTDKGEVTVASVSFDVGAATVQGGQLTLDQVVGSKFIVPQTVWAGEVFPLTYRITALKRFLNSLGSEHPEWDSLPLNPEPWPKYQVADELKNGEPWINVTYTTRAIARDPGEITLNPARHAVALNTGRRDIFGFAQQEQFAITSDQPKITVKPLPAGAPAKFSGAVGQFKLESKIVPENAAVGEPITWTLTLSGQGNWPDIQSLPSRSVSKDFHAIQPQVKRTPQGENALYEFTLSEDVVLVPTKPGPYTLGPVEWSYFDPAQGRYVTVTAPAAKITVAPAANAAAPIFAGSGTQAATPTPGALTLADAPKQPANIPGDPLPSAAPAPTPLPRSPLILYLLAAGLWPLLLWLVLAFLRARRTDPNRPQREARARIQKTLAAIDETPAAERERLVSLLQAWQHDTAILWKIPQVVPSASLFLKTNDKETGAAWSALWSDSERALYRAGSPLPPDWSARAHDALAAKRARGFNPLSLFAPRNLFPLAAALLVSISVLQPFSPSAFGATNTSSAQTPEAAYKSGDFKTAETAWRRAVEAAPTDWVSRHNLSLSLAQQDRWAEAGAHAFAAFVQHPNEPAMLRNVLLTLSRAGYTPSAVAEVTRPGPVREVALRYAPAQWQCALGMSVALAALAFAFVLLAVYGRRFRLPLFILAGAAFGFAALGVTVSLLSLHAYGSAKDERAVIVWKSGSLRSIPTVADTTQKTTPLAAGTVAIVDKDFPGWVRLVFEDGQTGWVPREDIVRLWK
ncbi:hypothetical protein M2447_000434 [Ereboglobus sp. PH5-10]|nr:hypothetical protein [Ereboglobus sp. PH5-10]